MPYFDFSCESNHLTEKKFSFDEFKNLPVNFAKLALIRCETCGKTAHRVFTRPGGINMNYPGGQRH